MKNNRRDFIKKSSTVAAALSVAGLGGYAASQTEKEKIFNKPAKKIEWPIAENPNALPPLVTFVTRCTPTKRSFNSRPTGFTSSTFL